MWWETVGNYSFTNVKVLTLEENIGYKEQIGYCTDDAPSSNALEKESL